MKNYSNPYLYPDEIGKVNAWEYYFTQPGNISLEDALTCKKYILGRDTAKHVRPEIIPEFFYNKRCKTRKLEYWRNICKKYIKFQPAVLEMLEREKLKLVDKKVLGVSVRGTDYVSLRLPGHQIQPEIRDVIAKTIQVMEEKNFNAVYLATEDKIIVAEFQKVFGKKLILPECDYIDFDYKGTKWVTACFSERENDKYLRGLEYLISKLLLLECNGLITSITSGSTGIMCLSEGFDYLYVFDLGLYP